MKNLLIASVTFSFLLLSCGKEEEKRVPLAEPITETPRYVQEIDWIDSTHRWHPAVDALGSLIDTVGGLFPEGRAARVGFTITPKTTEVWPYVELIFTAPQALSETRQVQFTYKCDKELIVKLSQTDFNAPPEGNGTWSYYQAVVPAANKWTTILLTYNRFSLPDWADESSRKIALNLNHVGAVYFTPRVDAVQGESTLLEIRHFRIF